MRPQVASDVGLPGRNDRLPGGNGLILMVRAEPNPGAISFLRLSLPGDRASGAPFEPVAVMYTRVCFTCRCSQTFAAHHPREPLSQGKTWIDCGTGNISGWLKGETMNRRHVLKILAEAKPVLQARFGVLRLALFGSTVTDSATAESDVDILVAFDGPATSKRYFGVQFYLEDLLGCPVDLVTEKALRPELRQSIEREQIRV